MLNITFCRTFLEVHCDSLNSFYCILGLILVTHMVTSQTECSTESKNLTLSLSISHSKDLLTPSSSGVFQLCLWPLKAPGYLGEGCHASHQPSDVSTPESKKLTIATKLLDVGLNCWRQCKKRLILIWKTVTSKPLVKEYRICLTSSLYFHAKHSHPDTKWLDQQLMDLLLGLRTYIY